MTLLRSARQTFERRPYVSLAVIFTMSRLLFYAFGVRFDASPLTSYWQYLDVELLRHRLLESLWYQHSQPPLFNLFLGIGLKLFGANAATFFAFTFFLLGLSLTLSLFHLLRQRLSNSSATCLALGFAVLPSTILYENYLFYAYPIAALLMMAASLLQRLETHPTTAVALLLGAVLSIIVLTWSAFHLIWLLLLTTVFYLSRRDAKQALIIFALPFLLTIGLYSKNFILFHNFGPSSWTGMNVAATITSGLDSTELKQYRSEGLLSDISLVGPFRTIDSYLPYVSNATRTGIPVLDQLTRSTGDRNMNNWYVAPISKQMLHDDFAMITHHPSVYLRHIPTNLFIYSHPPSEYFALASNRGEIALYEKLSRYLLYGEFSDSSLTSTTAPLSKRVLGGPLFMYLLLPMLIGYAIWILIKPSKHRSTLVFIAATVLYITLAGNLLEAGENNRFRFAIDPLLLLVGVDLFPRMRKKVNHSSSSKLS